MYMRIFISPKEIAQASNYFRIKEIDSGHMNLVITECVLEYNIG